MTANYLMTQHRYNAGKWESKPIQVIRELPVSLTINGEVWLTLMCTPTDLETLAAGFAFNEGLIRHRDEIASLRVCPTQDNVDLWLTHAVTRPVAWQRTSGCTGGMTAPVAETLSFDLSAIQTEVTPAILLAQMGELYQAQELYRQSGGVHTSALSDGQRIWLKAEDIGRHNTLDKLAGKLLLEGRTGSGCLVLTTGRISSEMLQKSARMGAALVMSRTSPSSMSVRLAERWGMTLIGYARRDGFTIYSHPERVISAPGGL